MSVDVSSYYGLAIRLANFRWRVYEVLPHEDYKQEAFCALVIAAEKFSETRGVKFTTFAWRCVEGALINAERSWQKWNRRSRHVPLFVPVPRGLIGTSAAASEEDVERLFESFAGKWFTIPARLVLFDGLTVAETARVCHLKPNAVHQAVTYFRRAVKAQLDAA